MIIKWTNKYSKETGYVKGISVKEGHFINTFDKSEAKDYASTSAQTRAMNQLSMFGEDNCNTFELI